VCVREVKQKIKVKGVGAPPQLIVDMVGDLEGFLEVYESEHTKANILSLVDVEDLYEITYSGGEAFVVHMKDRSIEFKCRDKLYIADLVTEKLYVYATVQENEQVCTKEEVRKEKQTYELVKNSRYPSPNEVLHLIQDGNMGGMPMLMVAALERAYKIHGMHPEYVYGRMTNRKVSRVQVDLGLCSTDKNLHLYTDVMHVDGCMFLIPVTGPLNHSVELRMREEFLPLNHSVELRMREEFLWVWPFKER
jgi:hypothetical protein